MKNQQRQIRTGNQTTAIVSVSEVRRITSQMIPPTFSKEEAEEYMTANCPTNYLLCNTWLLLVGESSERTMHVLKRYILAHGLISAIRMSAELASALNHGESNLSDYIGYPIWFDCFTNLGNTHDAFQRVKELLEFPKRYSPALQVDIALDGFRKFLEINSSRRHGPTRDSADRACPRVKYDDNYFISDIVSEVRKITDYTCLDYRFWQVDHTAFVKMCHESESIEELWYHVHEYHCTDESGCSNEDCYSVDRFTNKEVDRRNVENNILYFSSYFGHPSSGTTAELTSEYNTLLNKLKIWSGFVPYSVDIAYPWSTSRKYFYYEPCKMVAVPKSFKTPRLIAKEPVFRNWVGTALRELLTSMLEHTIDWSFIRIDDQDPNRDVAWEASFNQKYATVDQSSASDSISAGLGCTLFPLFSTIPWLRARTIDVSSFEGYSGTISSHVFLTSGHPLTFICETILFLAIARVATSYTRLWYDKRCKFVEPRSYGDDTELDCRAFDLFVCIMQSLGFTVNVDKSFTAPARFRESCGVEYLDGYPVHGVKWPRTCYDWTKSKDIADNIASLVDLQHALYSRSWKVNELLINFIREWCPTMTFSSPYSEYQDLWSDVELVEKVPAPHKAGYVLSTDDMCYQREIHAILQSQYQADPKELRNSRLELKLYLDFLRNGPIYANELDRLLKISMPVDRRPLVSVPTTRWTRVRR